MKNKFSILLFEYDKVCLYQEIDSKITKVDFANGKEYLSNCVSFDYDKEDLCFLPDGDPFDINNSSCFSEYLDFAGQNFEPALAIEIIIKHIIENNLIPNFGKNDEILIFEQSFYCDRKDMSSELVNLFSEISPKICGHKVYAYSCYGIIESSLDAFRYLSNKGFVLGFPFISVIQYDQHFFAEPFMERTAYKETIKRAPISNHLSPKLSRVIKNRIIMSKIFGFSINAEAIYQNRSITIDYSEYSKWFDEHITELSKLINKQREGDGEKPTDVGFLFDYGMIKNLEKPCRSKFKTIIKIAPEDNDILTVWFLRNMVIIHEAKRNPTFIVNRVKFKEELKKFGHVNFVDGVEYYNLRFIDMVLSYYKQKSIFSYREVSDLKQLIEE